MRLQETIKLSGTKKAALWGTLRKEGAPKALYLNICFVFSETV